MQNSQMNIFGEEEFQKIDSAFENLSKIPNMTKKGRELICSFPLEVQREIKFFIKNSSRNEAFQLIKIIVGLKDSGIIPTEKDLLKGRTNCPTCGKSLKIYRRSIRPELIHSLINLYKKEGFLCFVHIKEFMTRASTDFFICELFGLVEKMSNEDPKKRTSGFWRLTPFGKDFIQNRTSIPSYILLKNNKIIERSPESLSVNAILKSKGFDYRELFLSGGYL